MSFRGDLTSPRTVRTPVHGCNGWPTLQGWLLERRALHRSVHRGLSRYHECLYGGRGEVSQADVSICDRKVAGQAESGGYDPVTLASAACSAGAGAAAAAAGAASVGGAGNSSGTSSATLT